MEKSTVSQTVSLPLRVILTLGLLLLSQLAQAVPNGVETQQDLISGAEDTPISGNVLNNDTFDDKPIVDPVLLEIVKDPDHGSVAIDNSGTVNYTPDPDYSGTDFFLYRVTRLSFDCLSPGFDCQDVGRADVAIAPVADVPDLAAQNVVGDEDEEIGLDLDADLVDTDGSEELTLTLSGVPAGATLSSGTPLGGGQWSIPEGDLGGLKITPPANANGTVSLVFAATATDKAELGPGNSNTVIDSINDGVSFTVTVNPVDDPPLVVGAVPAVMGLEDSPLIVDLSGVFSDVDSPLNLQVTGISNAAIDTAVVNALQLEIIPLPDQNGTGTIEVTAVHPNDPVSISISVDIDQDNDTRHSVHP